MKDQTFIYMEKYSNILFYNVSIMNSSLINSKLIQTVYSEITIILSNFIDNTLINSNFIDSYGQNAKIYQNLITNNIFTLFSSFFTGSSYLLINDSMIIKNIIFNSSFLLINFEDQQEIMINYSVFYRNQGDLSNSFLFSLSGENLFLMFFDTLYTNNSNFISLINVVNSKEINIENNIFENNMVINIMNLMEISNITINLVQFVRNNQNNDIRVGPCLVIKNCLNFLIKNLEISDNLAFFNLAGLLIIQSIDLLSNYIYQYLIK